jgi:hypothetical protein
LKPVTKTSTRLDITIKPSLGSGLIILTAVYMLAATGIYFSWLKGNVSGIIVLSLLVLATYISILLKFNKEKKTYLDFIEKEILRKGETE